jgi:hypothetical protein
LAGALRLVLKLLLVLLLLLAAACSCTTAGASSPTGASVLLQVFVSFVFFVLVFAAA